MDGSLGLGHRRNEFYFCSRRRNRHKVAIVILDQHVIPEPVSYGKTRGERGLVVFFQRKFAVHLELHVFCYFFVDSLLAHFHSSTLCRIQQCSTDDRVLEGESPDLIGVELGLRLIHALLFEIVVDLRNLIGKIGSELYSMRLPFQVPKEGAWPPEEVPVLTPGISTNAMIVSTRITIVPIYTKGFRKFLLRELSVFLFSAFFSIGLLPLFVVCFLFSEDAIVFLSSGNVE